MRWFKHMTDTKSDEKIASLISIAGMEGYGFYWSIIELVAKQIDKGSDKCSVTYPLPYLSRQLYLHHNKVSNLLGKLQVTGLILLSKSEVNGGVSYTITCPNLLKYRDEYSERKAKEKAKNRENIPTNSRQTPEQETDTEADNRITDTDAEDKPEKIPGLYCDLLKALGKLQLTPEEYSIGEKLINNGCEIKDVENARLAKGKNNLKYLQNIVCEMRDQRLKEKEVHTFEFV